MASKPVLLVLFGLSLVKVHLMLSLVAITVSCCYAARKWYVFEKEQAEKKKEKQNRFKDPGLN